MRILLPAKSAALSNADGCHPLGHRTDAPCGHLPPPRLIFISKP